jgi:hypothetical protein
MCEGEDQVLKPEMILSLGAEEGSMTLYGIKLDDEWNFLLLYDKSTRTDFISQPSEDNLLKQDLMYRSGFQSALELLDEHSWHMLIPRTIHPDFAEQLLVEVEKRIPPGHFRLTFWRRLVARSHSLQQNKLEYM